jgi:hypothetical protein
MVAAMAGKVDLGQGVTAMCVELVETEPGDRTGPNWGWRVGEKN